MKPIKYTEHEIEKTIKGLSNKHKTIDLEKLLEIFKNDEDFHSHTGSAISGIEYLEFMERKRRGDPIAAATMSEEGGAGGLIKLLVLIAAVLAIYFFFLRN